MAELLDILKDAYANNYEGNIAELLRQASSPEVATTPEQQQTGLSEGPPRTMVFPHTQGQPFNTKDMSYPIDMQQFDDRGNLVRSYEKIPPGTPHIPGNGASTVIEQPSLYRTGGHARPSDTLRNYRPGSTLKRK